MRKTERERERQKEKEKVGGKRERKYLFFGVQVR